MPEATVTTTSATVIESKSRRRLLILQNNSDTDMYFRFGNKTAAASGANAGIKLATGDTFTLSPGGDMSDYLTLPIVAIHGGSGDKILTYEEV